METRTNWTKEEWEEMYSKLERLSLAQLRDLTTRVGIKFTVGNENITNPQDFILVLDEVDKEELLREYHDILANQRQA